MLVHVALKVGDCDNAVVATILAKAFGHSLFFQRKLHFHWPPSPLNSAVSSRSKKGVKMGVFPNVYSRLVGDNVCHTAKGFPILFTLFF